MEAPSNREAENNLLGITLMNGFVPLSAKTLPTTDFFVPQNRAVWSAILELEEEGKPINPLEVVEVLKSNNNPMQITVAELVRLTTGVYAGANDSVYVNKIEKAAKQRFLMKQLSQMIESVARGSLDFADLKRAVGNLEAEVLPVNAFRSLEEILQQEAREAIEDLRHGVVRRISTGFKAIDRQIGGGLSESDVLLVAADTGAGKSALVLQIAANIASDGFPVAFVAGEMSDKENVLRLISQKTKSFNLNSATHIPQTEYEYLQDWLTHEPFVKMPIYFNSSTTDIQTLGKQLRTLVSSKAIKVLVIDYIQLFKSDKSSKQRRNERIAEVSQEIRRLSMELNIAVIEVAQFNREGAKAGRATMHDLEGSGQLEKDASLIFILDREEDSNNIALRIVKGRNVGGGVVEGIFTGHNLNFEFRCTDDFNNQTNA